mmetsp:Transcript_16549/g.35805  ORF Transcript_16549/g.35805 Transcript_16549/m.35805 type:complete len:129 (+) Transcript_16549:181-567(+)
MPMVEGYSAAHLQALCVPDHYAVMKAALIRSALQQPKSACLPACMQGIPSEFPMALPDVILRAVMVAHGAGGTCSCNMALSATMVWHFAATNESRSHACGRMMEVCDPCFGRLSCWDYYQVDGVLCPP